MDIRIVYLHTFRTYRMSDTGIRVGGDVIVYLLPVVLVVAYFLAE